MKSTKKWVALFLTLLLALSLTVTSAMASDNPVADARNGVVRIVFTYTLDGEPSGQMGTGFFIGEEGKPVEFILTNAHVVTVYDEYTGDILGTADEVDVVFDDYNEDSTMTAKVLKIFDNGVDLVDVEGLPDVVGAAEVQGLQDRPDVLLSSGAEAR